MNISHHFQQFYTRFFTPSVKQDEVSVIDDLQTALTLFHKTGNEEELLTATKDIQALYPYNRLLSKPLHWILTNYSLPIQESKTEFVLLSLESLNLLARHDPSIFSPIGWLNETFSNTLELLPSIESKSSILSTSLSYQLETKPPHHNVQIGFYDFLHAKSVELKGSPGNDAEAPLDFIIPIDHELANFLQKAIDYQDSPAMNEIFLAQALDKVPQVAPADGALSLLIKINEEFYNNRKQEPQLYDVFELYREAFQECAQRLPHLWQRVGAYSFLKNNSSNHTAFAENELGKIMFSPKMPSKRRIKRFLKESTKSRILMPCV